MSFASIKPFLSAGIFLLYARATGRIIPWYVNFFITSACNLRCPYCYVSSNQGKQYDPTLEQIKSNIDILYSLGTRWIALLGGEPLLRNDLPYIVDYILEKNMLVSLSTNGTIINRHLSSLQKVHRITVSLEGDPDGHDKDRGHGSYAKAVATLKWLKDNGCKGVTFQTTIGFSNKDSWHHVLDVAIRLNASVLFTEIACAPDVNSDSLNLSFAEREAIWTKIRDMKQQGFPVENSFQAIDTLLKYGSKIGLSEVFGGSAGCVPPYLKRFDTTCPMGRYNFFLSHDMRLSPCASLFNIEVYDARFLGLENAYKIMSSSQRCNVCRMRMNYRTDFLFSSFSPSAMFSIAFQAMKSLNFR